MSNELPPPPPPPPSDGIPPPPPPPRSVVNLTPPAAPAGDVPPPPPAAGGDAVAQAPKLNLRKPAGLTPPPVPSAGFPVPSPVSPSAPRPVALVATRSVGQASAAIDLLTLAASLGGVVVLALELFVKSQG